MKSIIAQNTFWLTFGEIIGRGLRALLAIFIARILGAYDFGILSYVLSLAAFLTIFSDIGISSVLTREISKKPEQKKTLIATAFFLKIGLIVLAVLSIVVLSPFFIRKEIYPLLFLVFLLLFFDSLREGFFGLVRAYQKMHLEAANKILVNSAIILLVLFFIFYSPSPENFFLSYVLGSFLGLVFFVFVFRKDFFTSFGFFNKKLIPCFLKSGFSFALFGFLTPLMIVTDQLMLGYFRTISEVGFYAAAFRPLHLILIFSMAISAAFFPSLVKLSENKEKFRALFKKGLGLIFLLSLVIVFFGFVFSAQIINLLYGQPYFPSLAPFRILVFSLIFSYPALFLANGLFALNKQKVLIKYFLLGFLANIFFNFLLIPEYGIIGCALATVLTLSLTVLFAFLKLKNIIFSSFPNVRK